MFILLNSEFLCLRSVQWILADLYSFYQIRNFCILSPFYSHFIKRRIRAIKEMGNRTPARRLRIFDQRSKGIFAKKEKQCQSMFINPCFINPCFIKPRTYMGGGGGGWLPPPSEVFLIFFPRR